MRPMMCCRDTMRVVGRKRKPTKITMLVAYLKKCMHIHSPSTGGYEYDYLKARYFGGKKNG